MSPARSYVLIETAYYIRTNPLVSYGIALVETDESEDTPVDTVLQTVSNISADRQVVLDLVQRLNRVRPGQEELYELVEAAMG